MEQYKELQKKRLILEQIDNFTDKYGPPECKSEQRNKISVDIHAALSNINKISKNIRCSLPPNERIRRIIIELNDFLQRLIKDQKTDAAGNSTILETSIVFLILSDFLIKDYRAQIEQAKITITKAKNLFDIAKMQLMAMGIKFDMKDFFDRITFDKWEDRLNTIVREKGE